MNLKGAQVGSHETARRLELTEHELRTSKAVWQEEKLKLIERAAAAERQFATAHKAHLEVLDKRMERALKAERAADQLRTEINEVRAKWATEINRNEQLARDAETATSYRKAAEKAAAELRKDPDRAEIERLRADNASKVYSLEWAKSDLKREIERGNSRVEKIKELEIALAQAKKTIAQGTTLADFFAAGPMAILNNRAQFKTVFGYPVSDYVTTRLTEDAFLFTRNTSLVSGPVVRKLHDGKIELEGVITPQS
jgi:hypothetical protein